MAKAKHQKRQRPRSSRTRQHRAALARAVDNRTRRELDRWRRG